MSSLEEITDCPLIAAKVIDKNFITIEKKIRERYNLEVGSKFLYKITHIISRPNED